MDPKIPPKAMTDPTQDDPSSSIPNPVELLLSWRLAALVQPVKLPQLNIPMETERLALAKVQLFLPCYSLTSFRLYQTLRKR